jgi:hypothetical protein
MTTAPPATTHLFKGTNRLPALYDHCVCGLSCRSPSTSTSTHRGGNPVSNRIVDLSVPATTSPLTFTLT